MAKTLFFIYEVNIQILCFNEEVSLPEMLKELPTQVAWVGFG
ncbi:MAG: hypothetical protein O3C43_25070 [Verrucomicrobia bacterium]|nr:hypothetical protein [Verrucomicrobiota bacterium]